MQPGRSSGRQALIDEEASDSRTASSCVRWGGQHQGPGRLRDRRLEPFLLRGDMSRSNSLVSWGNEGHGPHRGRIQANLMEGREARLSRSPNPFWPLFVRKAAWPAIGASSPSRTPPCLSTLVRTRNASCPPQAEIPGGLGFRGFPRNRRLTPPIAHACDGEWREPSSLAM